MQLPVGSNAWTGSYRCGFSFLSSALAFGLFSCRLQGIPALPRFVAAHQMLLQACLMITAYRSAPRHKSSTWNLEHFLQQNCPSHWRDCFAIPSLSCHTPTITDQAVQGPCLCLPVFPDSYSLLCGPLSQCSAVLTEALKPGRPILLQASPDWSFIKLFIPAHVKDHPCYAPQPFQPGCATTCRAIWWGRYL